MSTKITQRFGSLTRARTRVRSCAALAVLLSCALLPLGGCVTNLDDPRFTQPGPAGRVIMGDAYRETLNQLALPHADAEGWSRAMVKVMKYDAAHQKLLSPQLARYLEFLSGASRKEPDESDWIAAIRSFHETNARSRAVLVNPYFSAFSPSLILPLDTRTYTPSPLVRNTLLDIYGPSADVRDLKVYRIAKDAKERFIGGLTLGPVAFVNDHVIEMIARQFKVDRAIVRDIIIANESAHVVANRLNLGDTFESIHARHEIEQALKQTTRLTAQHVHEFLSDVVSLSLDPVGLPILMESAGAAIGRRQANGDFFIDLEHPYALSAEVLLNSLTRHAKEHLNAEAYAVFSSRVYWSATLLPDQVPTRLYEAVKADFMDQGREVLSVVR